MSTAQPEVRRTSPLLSNNPFRNHVGSDPPSPLPTTQSNGKAISTNPFLDANEVTEKPAALSVVNSADIPSKEGLSENTRELFNLSVKDRAQSPRRAPPPPANGTRRQENIPLRPFGRMPPPPGHRPSQSQEERLRRQLKSSKGPPTGELDIFADPPNGTRPMTRDHRPARRNSESSIREKTDKTEPEDEKRRRERRHKEKRHGKPKVDGRKLDVIDKLDVTSIYGMGLFHHDGPFDACNPNRNRKGSKQAPMQAFPKDSRNMMLGGSGPINSRLNLEQIHGTGQEAHIDFNEAAVADEPDAEYIRRAAPIRSASFNPIERIEPVHGQETIGLGTSTFLEGAPASRQAIQRRESENEPPPMNGLSRKKSLAQKIRAVRPGGGRVTSPEPQVLSPTSPLGTAKSEISTNPFFKEYDQEYEKKGQQIAFAQQEQKTGRARAPSSPKRGGLGLERKMTQENAGGEDSKSGGGFLSRVKSLKGGRTKARGEKRDASS